MHWLKISSQTVNQDADPVSIASQLSIEKVSIKYRSSADLKGTDQHSTLDALVHMILDT